MLSLALLLAVSTWQTWDGEMLTVYTGGEGSAVYYQGASEDYDGTATNPVAPTPEYTEKRSDLKRADILEQQGQSGEAQQLRAKWL